MLMPEVDNFETHDEYKSAINEWHWNLKCSTVSKYLERKYSNPGAASKYLSAFFNKSKTFEVALFEEDTEALLSAQEALAVLKEWLKFLLIKKVIKSWELILLALMLGL